jgi:electron transfer flavoprotein beta subunit
MMNVLVCVKQIFNPDAPIRIDKSKRWIEPENHAAFRMNHFDEFALEEALKIRETFPGVRVDVLSVGPKHIEPTLKRALGMGADEGIHILMENDCPTPYEIASFIASWVRDKHYHLILTGVMSEDTMHGQVGQMVAEILGIPCVTSTIFEKLSEKTNSIYVEREIEGGLREAFELVLPALLTIQIGINRPRYPALSHVLRAKAQSVITVPADTLVSTYPSEHIVRVCFPGSFKKGIFLQGSAEEKALQLLNVFHERALI